MTTLKQKIIIVLIVILIIQILITLYLFYDWWKSKDDKKENFFTDSSIQIANLEYNIAGGGPFYLMTTDYKYANPNIITNF